MKLRYKIPQIHRNRLYVSLSACGTDLIKPQVCCTESPYPLKALGQQEFPPLLGTTRIVPMTRIPLPIRTTQIPVSSTKAVSKKFECGGIVDNRIYGGSEAKIDEMPFTAVLIYSKGEV